MQQHRGEQYIELPRAICTPDGVPHKGQKSYTTTYLEKRYSNIVNKFPGGWVPDSVILEGMFLINTTPLASHSAMKEYVMFLFKRFIHPHLSAGAKEVHVIFDNPGRQPCSPKAVEQSRRDAVHELPADHQHGQFTDSSSIPAKWREYLHCRTCK